jgi:glucokinase
MRDLLMSRYAIGADLGGTNVRTALVRDDGTCVKSLRRRTVGDAGTYEHIKNSVDVLVALLDDLLAAPDVAGYSLDGVGVGVTGLINRSGAFIGGKGPPDIYQHPLPIRERLAGRLEMPVWVENDSKAAAWGEYCYGAGRGADSMICLTVGTGIGGGIVLDGRLFHGADGLAGHVGFMTLDLHGTRGPSGAVGYLEQLASGTAIAQMAGMPGESVFEAYRQGDATARDVIKKVTYALGVAVASLLHILNPDVVVIGGGVAEQGDMFLDLIRTVVRDSSMINFRATQIRAAELGDAAGVIGAAALCWQDGPKHAGHAYE